MPNTRLKRWAQVIAQALGFLDSPLAVRCTGTTYLRKLLLGGWPPREKPHEIG